MLRRAIALLCLLVLPFAVIAQDNAAPRGKVWVQVASEPELPGAVASAERYARDFDFTRVFLTRNGRFAIALGVVDATQADDTLSALIRRGQIPGDTLTVDGADYLTEIWSAQRAANSESGYEAELADAIAREARFSEEERRAVQSALLWTGDYTDRIDGVFGPNTRGAIRAFQERQGVLVTGYLTGTEIAALVEEGSARREAAGWRILDDAPNGIRTGLATAFFDAPEETNLGLRLDGRGPGRGALLSLLSRTGGAPTLDDLYDTARNDLLGGADFVETRSRTGFVISGRSGDRVIHSFAERRGDAVRGFILSYPVRIADLMDPIARAMMASFEHRAVATAPRLGDEMRARPPARRDDPDAMPDPRRTPDSPRNTGTGVAGDPSDRTRPRPNERADLDPPRTRPEPRFRPDPRVRPDPRMRPEPPRRDRPRIRRDDRDVDSTGTGFYVTTDGKLVTNFHVVDGCVRMIVDGNDEAEVLAVDRRNDLALLQHSETRTEAEVARFAAEAPRLNSDVTVVGYPLYGLLGGLNVTRGVISSLAGLRGNQTFIQISAEVQPGNSGGPALDARGYVVGVVQSKLNAVKLSEETGDIPQNVNFAIRAEIARDFLSGEGIEVLTGDNRDALEPADLAEAAQRFTVLLECIK